MADFPTPGSPMSIGLFFFLLLKICETLSISSCLPTTGSNFPSSANLVKSLPKLSKTGVLDLLAPPFLAAVPLPPENSPPPSLAPSSESGKFASVLGKLSKLSSAEKLFLAVS